MVVFILITLSCMRRNISNSVQVDFIHWTDMEKYLPTYIHTCTHVRIFTGVLKIYLKRQVDI